MGTALKDNPALQLAVVTGWNPTVSTEKAAATLSSRMSAAGASLYSRLNMPMQPASWTLPAMLRSGSRSSGDMQLTTRTTITRSCSMGSHFNFIRNGVW